LTLLSHNTSSFHFLGESVTLFGPIFYGFLVAETNRNNKLLEENNAKLSEQNDKMLKYTKSIHWLTAAMLILAGAQLLIVFLK